MSWFADFATVAAAILGVIAYFNWRSQYRKLAKRDVAADLLLAAHNVSESIWFVQHTHDPEAPNVSWREHFLRSREAWRRCQPTLDAFERQVLLVKANFEGDSIFPALNAQITIIETHLREIGSTISRLELFSEAQWQAKDSPESCYIMQQLEELFIWPKERHSAALSAAFLELQNITKPIIRLE